MAINKICFYVSKLTLLIAMFACTGVQKLDNEYGFNGIQFETTVDSKNGYIPASDEFDGVQQFRRKESPATLYNLPIKEAFYHSYKGKLFSVSVYFSRPSDSGILLDSLTESYGVPSESAPPDQETLNLYQWQGDKVILSLEVDAQRGTTLLMYKSIPLLAQYSESRKNVEL